MPGLEVTLVLCTADGELLGAAAPFRVENEWWRDVEDVVAGARAALGAEVRVLRILDVPRDTDFPGGGHVTYLAEIQGATARDPLGPHSGHGPTTRCSPIRTGSPTRSPAATSATSTGPGTRWPLGTSR